MEEERRHAVRRSEDQCTGADCPAAVLEGELKELKATVVRLEEEATALRNDVLEELRAIKKQNDTQLEIMAAWNSAKGFVKTVQVIGRVATWIVKITAVLAALWALLRYGGHPPT